MRARCRFPVVVLLCLLTPLLLAACDDEDAGPSGPPSCAGSVVTPAADAVLVAGERCAIRWAADLGAAAPAWATATRTPSTPCAWRTRASPTAGVPAACS